MHRLVSRARGWTVGVAALCLLVPGCSTSGKSSGSDLGYISGDGNVQTVAAVDRGDPIGLTGTTLDGRKISVGQYRGKVVVINVWGQWCAECRVEQDGLVDAANKLRGTAFLGIDVRESSPAPGRAYVADFDVPYPSLYDPDGTALLVFHDSLPPNAIPSTIFLDARGRVAARILGPTSALTIEGVVHDLEQEEG